MTDAPSTGDPWVALRRFTDARIGLGRSGSALPTREVLKFSMAHAKARDAVTTPIDWTPVEAGIRALGPDTLRVHSAADNRDTYLKRPGLGRKLGSESASNLTASNPDLVIVIGDGLSSTAVAANAVAFISAFLPWIERHQWTLGPVVLASEARVAIGDDIGERIGGQAVIVLIGERPGLSSPDSLGAYLTYAPRVGRKDAERNCISNIRAGGLSHAEAAFKLAWLLDQAIRRKLTGVALKDESEFLLPAPASAELSSRTAARPIRNPASTDKQS